MSNGYMGGGADPSSYMMRYLMKELFGGTGDDKELKEMQKELTRLRLEGARDPSTLNTISTRLDNYIKTIDTSKPENIEKIHNKINTALKGGLFGNKPENVQFVKNYLEGITTTGTILSEVNNTRKNLYNSTNFSHVSNFLDSVLISDDKDA